MHMCVFMYVSCVVCACCGCGEFIVCDRLLTMSPVSSANVIATSKDLYYNYEKGLQLLVFKSSGAIGIGLKKTK